MPNLPSSEFFSGLLSGIPEGIGLHENINRNAEQRLNARTIGRSAAACA